jgi:hypothetical protein
MPEEVVMVDDKGTAEGVLSGGGAPLRRKSDFSERL